MSTVLPLSAAQNPGHPLLALAKEMPDLRGDRLPQGPAHVLPGRAKAEDATPSPVGPWIRQLVGALMPLSFRFNATSRRLGPMGSADDRLDARLKMQSSSVARSSSVGPPTSRTTCSMPSWPGLHWQTTNPDAAAFVNRLATQRRARSGAHSGGAPFGSPVERDHVAFVSERPSLHGFGRLRNVEEVPAATSRSRCTGASAPSARWALQYLVLGRRVRPRPPDRRSARRLALHALRAHEVPASTSDMKTATRFGGVSTPSSDHCWRAEP